MRSAVPLIEKWCPENNSFMHEPINFFFFRGARQGKQVRADLPEHHPISPEKAFWTSMESFPRFQGVLCVGRGREGALDDGGGQVTRQKCSTRRVLSRRPGALE